MSDWSKTHRVPGEVFFVIGGTLAGDLHLQPSTELHQSVETPLEMLNRSERFFAVTLPDGDVRLVSKDQAVIVSVGSEAPDPEWNPTPGASDLRLEVTMTNGREFEGEVRAELPPPRTRTLDFLNVSERFFALTHSGTAWYLNRAHVLHVRPLD